jgi:hypothetical protein
MDRLRQLENEVQDLKMSLAELRLQVTNLLQERKLHQHPLEALLRQRGLPILSHGDCSRLVLPPNAPAIQKTRFYRFMQRYSFRLFLRDLIQLPEGGNLKALTRYCSLNTVRSYMKFLSEMGVVQIHPDKSYQFIQRQITSFGPTLEWYVNEIFQREFLAPSRFGVRLLNTKYGGDYDVIAILTGCLIYVEVKSSPPRGVEQTAVAAFLRRLHDLQPNMAVFMVDTELRMRDKIVPMFADAMKDENLESEEWQVSRLVGEIFHIGHSIYLINSRKGIYSNLRFCVRDYLNWGKKAGQTRLL